MLPARICVRRWPRGIARVISARLILQTPLAGRQRPRIIDPFARVCSDPLRRPRPFCVCRPRPALSQLLIFPVISRYARKFRSAIPAPLRAVHRKIPDTWPPGEGAREGACRGDGSSMARRLNFGIDNVFCRGRRRPYFSAAGPRPAPSAFVKFSAAPGVSADPAGDDNCAGGRKLLSDRTPLSRRELFSGAPIGGGNDRTDKRREFRALSNFDVR